MPPAELLTAEHFWNKKGQPDLGVLMKHLNYEGVVAQDLVLDICKKAAELFESEPNLLKLNDPITVVGDIHGQYYDLVKLLEVGGQPGDTQYIFLGDYVDRGSFSVEVVLTMYALKILHPKRVRMLRGNHECRQMTSFFNFREECEHKYDSSVYNAFMDSFDNLPLAATINGKFLVVHGGLSPELPTVKAINKVNRFQEPPREGLLCDLLWSDPLEPKEGAAGPKVPKKSTAPFVPNGVRGCSYFFTFEGVATFLKKNQLLSVIRAHEAQLEGYKMHKTNPSTGFPSVITIFSAPNYCDVYNNKGAILKFDNSTLNILQFNCCPHPYHLPNFMDVFTWSMPFVIEKVTEMLYYVLQPSAGKLEDEAEEESLPEMLQPGPVENRHRASLSAEQNKVVDIARKLAISIEQGEHKAAEADDDGARDRMRKKVRTIARMARMFKTLRQENETIIRLKGVCPGHKLAPGLLLAGKEKLKSEVEVFQHVENIDAVNEMRPVREGSGDDAFVPVQSVPRDFAEAADEPDDEDADAKRS